jgi:hypothetical protein
LWCKSFDFAPINHNKKNHLTGRRRQSSFELGSQFSLLVPTIAAPFENFRYCCYYAPTQLQKKDESHSVGACPCSRRSICRC